MIKYHLCVAINFSIRLAPLLPILLFDIFNSFSVDGITFIISRSSSALRLLSHKYNYLILWLFYCLSRVVKIG